MWGCKGGCDEWLAKELSAPQGKGRGPAHTGGFGRKPNCNSNLSKSRFPSCAEWGQSRDFAKFTVSVCDGPG